MPITHSPGGTTFTGDSIAYYRLAVLRSAVGLELKGIRVTRRSATAQAKREFGIKGSRQTVYDWLTAKVAEVAAQQTHITEDGR